MKHATPNKTSYLTTNDLNQSPEASAFDTAERDLAGLDISNLTDALRRDQEFIRLSRNLTARLRIRVGVRSLLFTFHDGELASVTTLDTGFDSTHIVVDVPEPVWEEMMRAEPRPFYQDFWSAKFHHGVRIEGDFDLMSAYYGAIRRIGQLARAQVSGRHAA